MGAWFLLFFRTLVREKTLLIVYVGLSAVFLLAFHASLGSPASGFSGSLRVEVLMAAPGAAPVPGALEALERVQAARYNGTKALTVEVVSDPGLAWRAVTRGQASLVLDLRAVPPTILADPGSALAPYAESFVRQALADGPEPFTLGYASGSGGSNDFLYWIPGLLVFGAAFGALVASILLVQELRRRTFDRIRLAAGRVMPLAAGLWLALLVLTAAQAGLALGLAALLGYEFPVGPLALAGGVVLEAAWLSLLALGLGLLTAALVDREASATMVSMMAVAPFAFFTGTFFPVPSLQIATLFGQPLYALDVLAPAPLVRALSDLWVRGLPAAEALPVPMAVAGLGVLAVLIPALVLFRIRRLNQGA